MPGKKKIKLSDRAVMPSGWSDEEKAHRMANLNRPVTIDCGRAKRSKTLGRKPITRDDY